MSDALVKDERAAEHGFTQSVLPGVWTRSTGGGLFVVDARSEPMRLGIVDTSGAFKEGPQRSPVLRGMADGLGQVSWVESGTLKDLLGPGLLFPWEDLLPKPAVAVGPFQRPGEPPQGATEGEPPPAAGP